MNMLAVDCDRAGRRINDNRQFKSPCGNSEEVAKRVGSCIVEVFDLVDGRFEDPQNDADLIGHCNRFNATDRCARSVAKDCLHGLHKTATSAVASAAKRFRTTECKTAASRSRYVDALKCAHKKGPEMSGVFRNFTGMFQAIRDLDASPEDKLVKMCCALNSLDREMEVRYNRECPKSTPLVIGILHALTDDARSTLCVSPKCNHALDKVIGHKYTPPQNLIEPIMQILFLLNVN